MPLDKLHRGIFFNRAQFKTGSNIFKKMLCVELSKKSGHKLLMVLSTFGKLNFIYMSKVLSGIEFAPFSFELIDYN